MEYEMTFYCTREPDSTVHVQNAVSGFLGQHYVHTPDDFERRKLGVPESQIVWLDAAPCDYALKPGEVRSRR